MKQATQKENAIGMDRGVIFESLLKLARRNGIRVLFSDFRSCYGMLYGNRVGIANDIDIDKINYTLAHELAHAYLHYDKGNILEDNETYEEQADRAARMLLDAIQVS